MLYIKAYSKKTQECQVKDTSDGSSQIVGVSEVRKLVSRGIQIPGVLPDKIIPVTEEQAINQELALLKLILRKNIEIYDNTIRIDCTDIDKLTLPAVPYDFRIVGQGNTSIELTPDWEIITESTFGSDCTGIANIVIPDSVRVIKDRAFMNCSWLTNISIPVGVKSIEGLTFRDCVNLVNVTIPDSVINIERYAFKDCTSLADIIIPNSVKSIRASAFMNCSSLENITIPGSVIGIEANAFCNCKNLANVIISDGVICIEANAFCNCKSLVNVIIPDSVIDIGVDVFKCSYNLVIWCSKGSCAEQYAVKNGLQYKIKECS